MVEDPLKSFESILEPDPRYESFVGGLKAWHEELVEIWLNAAIPKNVQQLFETARNVSLYAWFVYRFHQVSESVAFQALELGLRQRCETDPEFQAKQRRPNLRTYLTHSVARGWISSSGFSSMRRIAVARAKMRKVVEAIGAENSADVISVPEPTDEDVEIELSTLTYIERLVSAIPVHRNALAHGSSMLAPTSRGVLRTVADVLNQLYPTDLS